MTILLLRMKKSPHLVILMMRIMMKRMMLRIGIIGQEVMVEPMQRNLTVRMKASTWIVIFSKKSSSLQRDERKGEESPSLLKHLNRARPSQCLIQKTKPSQNM